MSNPSVLSSVPAQDASTVSDPPPYSQPGSISPFRMELATHLGVPAHLVGPGDVSLRVAYQKYCAYLMACQTLDQMHADKSWMGKKPGKTELVEIFVSKSFVHSHYKRLFSKVVEYPDMVEWLECKGEQGSDVEVWGVDKGVYVYKDLEIWLDNGGTLEIEEKALKKEGKGGKRGDKKDKESKKNKKKEKKEKKEKKGSSRKMK